MSTENKHTPGPFLARKGTEHDPERWIVVANNGARAYLIATIENGQPGDTLETEAATAKLFAAAPELLSSLQDTLALARIKWGNLDPNANEVFSAAEAAISKATGKGEG